MIKARIIVKGRVQDVGYRTIVKQIARGFGIKGLVRNAENGSVEIFCETDRETLEEFKKMIDIKSPLEDLFGVNVENIDEHTEGTKNYVNPPEKFEYFHIDYLNEDLLKTSVERAEIGILAFKAMHKDLKKGQNELKEGQKDVIKGQKDMREGQDSMLKEQSAMHQDMNKSFKESDENMNKNFNRLNETIGTKFESMDVKYGDISKTMREMHNDLKEMKNLFAKLVNHIVKE
ncbi:MAG: acylphosphatase [Candidatus Thermoplasmatota archaeon]|nr:acylphosphatase [Candidatus Thermoplasmatota archaeon]